ncbi:unnamed protein product [Clonostachys chloroleuca]|uniref:Uncharacterized protein n=1 Tax=Clonostachys chloroleuca TaxID=1926264 RepID=A0AA35M4G6_9HYPO|nr:unnamed protein product [Clonostachys chloroleuca]
MRPASLLTGLSATVVSASWPEHPGAAHSPGFATSYAARIPIKPSNESARANAFRIFNAIHSAGRQWGTAVYHNGFCFMPAIMPKGTITYHGAPYKHPPAGFEWLAYEIEHAENFARSEKHPHRPPPPPWKGEEAQFQKPLQPLGPSHTGAQEDSTSSISDGQSRRGYLQTYQANRDLHLLLIDGMSAAKTSMGTLDSQDLLLRENKTFSSGIWDEWQRAEDICSMIADWGYDGFIRDEIGFEVVYCDFSQGLDLISSTRSFFQEDKMGDWSLVLWQWVRAAGERYDGISNDRVRIDFSSMVSGFFFPINISSTVPERPDLERLGAAPLEELVDIKHYLAQVAKQPRRFNVDWQGAVIDLIVNRYADRIAHMATEDISTDHFIQELEGIALGYINAPEDDGSEAGGAYNKANETMVAVHRCTQHYLHRSYASRSEWSASDELIHTAISSIMEGICSTVFIMRSMLLQASGRTESTAFYIDRKSDNDEMRRAVELSKAMTRNMVEKLGWADWKRTRPCPINEVLFVAMWPFGNSDDHWNPGCRTIDDLASGTRMGYWFMDRPPPPP